MRIHLDKRFQRICLLIPHPLENPANFDPVLCTSSVYSFMICAFNSFTQHLYVECSPCPVLAQELGPRGSQTWISLRHLFSNQSGTATFPSLSGFSLVFSALVRWWSIGARMGARNTFVNEGERACAQEGICGLQKQLVLQLQLAGTYGS